MRAAVPIDDPDDPRIAAYRSVRERDAAGRTGEFIAEGEVVLRVLARRSRHRAVSLLIAADRLTRLGELIAEFPTQTTVFSAAQPVMDAIVGFPIHRGVLALGRRAPPVAPEALLASLPEEALIAALFGIGNHDNMGGLFRNAAAFGVAAVVIDAQCCDPLYRKAIRVSVGEALTVPFARIEKGDDAVGLLQRNGFDTFSLSPGGAKRLNDLRGGPRCAILFGSEGHGLPSSILAATTTVSIAMAAGVDSLNVATASGIVLHHLARRASGAGH